MLAWQQCLAKHVVMSFEDWLQGADFLMGRPRIAPHVTITLVMLETINAWEKKMGF